MIIRLPTMTMPTANEDEGKKTKEKNRDCQGYVRKS